MNRVWSRFRALKSAIKNEEPASTIPLERPISSEEHAIAQWLLLHSNPAAISFPPQTGPRSRHRAVQLRLSKLSIFE
jgi:hypothetical protein